mgnify:CR=1 FL=1
MLVQQQTKATVNITTTIDGKENVDTKVFEGTIQSQWKEALSKTQLFETLEQNHEIDFETYEKLHKKEQKSSIQQPKNEWILERIENQIPNLIGARYYKWID